MLTRDRMNSDHPGQQKLNKMSQACKTSSRNYIIKLWQIITSSQHTHQVWFIPCNRVKSELIWKFWSTLSFFPADLPESLTISFTAQPKGKSWDLLQPVFLCGGMLVLPGIGGDEGFLEIYINDIPSPKFFQWNRIYLSMYCIHIHPIFIFFKCSLCILVIFI
jgi:hypothetical protein